MKKESPILKYASVLLIVLGAVEAAVSIRGFFDIPALHEAAIELQLANPVPVLVASGVFSLLIAAAELVAGILGYRYRARPKKAGACIPCGIAALSPCSSTFTFCSSIRRDFPHCRCLSGLSFLPSIFLEHTATKAPARQSKIRTSRLLWMNSPPIRKMGRATHDKG